MRNSTVIILAALVLVAALALPAGALVKPGVQVKDLRLPDSQGASQQLGQLIKGKVAMIIYWSLSCPHCQREIPRLMRLARRFNGNPFVVITVNADGVEMAQAINAYAKQQRIPGPYLIDAGPGDSLPFADFFDLYTTPSIMVVDRRGRVTFADEAEVDMDALIKAVQAAF